MKVASVLILILISMNSHSDTIHIPSNKDNTLFESSTEALSSGAGEYFFVGRTAQLDNTRRRGLLRFDLSAIPNGSVIDDVTLEITSSLTTVSSPQSLTLFTVNQDWGESSSNSTGSGGGGGGGNGTSAEPGDATWTAPFHDMGPDWNTAGGDYNPTPSATTAAQGTGLVTFNSLNLANDLQNWLDNPTNNFGWIVIGNEASSSTAFRFNSRENASNPPNLIVNFTPPPVMVQFNPAKDNTLFENPFGDTSNGAGGKLFAGKIQNAAIRRGLLEFDVSSIPSAATISSVSIQLNVLNIPPGSTNGDVHLHLALAEWGEGSSVATGSGGGQPATAEPGDATWLYTFYDDTTPLSWVNPGGDYAIDASATVDFGTGTGSIVFSSTTELIADVSTWIQNSNDNHGWVIVGDEIMDGNVRSFGSKEAGGTAPVLTIEYSVLDLIFADGFETNE